METRLELKQPLIARSQYKKNNNNNNKHLLKRLSGYVEPAKLLQNPGNEAAS